MPSWSLNASVKLAREGQTTGYAMVRLTGNRRVVESFGTDNYTQIEQLLVQHPEASSANKIFHLALGDLAAEDQDGQR